MNDKELLDLLADDAPLLPPDYPIATLRRARRVRRGRALAIGGGTVGVVASLLLAQIVLRPIGGPWLPSAHAGNTFTGVVYFYEATDEQRAAVEFTLEQTPGISKIVFVTREEAYERFTEQFKDHPDLVISVSPKEIPESYEFVTSVRMDRHALLYQLRALPGVGFVASPNPRLVAQLVETLPNRATEMGLPEAQVFSEQLILLARAHHQAHHQAHRQALPRTVYIVDNFCPSSLASTESCVPQQRFSAALRSNLQTLVGKYASVEFIARLDQVNPLASDEVIVTLSPLPAHYSRDATLRLEMRTAEHTEVAEFTVSWNGWRWIVGPWVGGSVS